MREREEAAVQNCYIIYFNHKKWEWIIMHYLFAQRKTDYVEWPKMLEADGGYWFLIETPDTDDAGDCHVVVSLLCVMWMVWKVNFKMQSLSFFSYFINKFHAKVIYDYWKDNSCPANFVSSKHHPTNTLPSLRLLHRPKAIWTARKALLMNQPTVDSSSHETKLFSFDVYTSLANFNWMSTTKVQNFFEK